MNILTSLRTAIMLLVVLTILTGVIYPGVVTVAAQVFFPWEANGSFLKKNGKVVGSLWIGQFFHSDDYFHGRPSATKPFPYNAAYSSGSNAGPSSHYLRESIRQYVAFEANLSSKELIPVDLVTTSASGLDPDISPLAAFYQVSRIALARHVSQYSIHQIIAQLIKNRSFFILGEPRVNVLKLNLALDKTFPRKPFDDSPRP